MLPWQGKLVPEQYSQHLVATKFKGDVDYAVTLANEVCRPRPHLALSPSPSLHIFISPSLSSSARRARPPPPSSAHPPSPAPSFCHPLPSLTHTPLPNPPPPCSARPRVAGAATGAAVQVAAFPPHPVHAHSFPAHWRRHGALLSRHRALHGSRAHPRRRVEARRATDEPRSGERLPSQPLAVTAATASTRCVTAVTAVSAAIQVRSSRGEPFSRYGLSARVRGLST